tara:strand:+ start:473 stop:745 length:273 start_codon:yes stop_codon:yes gene_type:complete
MKYYKIKVERTYTTEVFVKCKDEETLQNFLDASPTEIMFYDAQTNLWDNIFDEEMEQCNVTEQIATVDESYQTEHEIFFDLDNELKKTNA